jgi:hypothetical protein
MNKTMYEINWHDTNGEFTHCTVTPITVTREGILPGCTLPSISAVDHRGQRFTGVLSSYYDTEQAAWADVVDKLSAEMAANYEAITKLSEQNSRLRGYIVRVQHLQEHANPPAKLD